eukprot:2701632-Prymnesium_polylepis.1
MEIGVEEACGSIPKPYALCSVAGEIPRTRRSGMEKVDRHFLYFIADKGDLMAANPTVRAAVCLRRDSRHRTAAGLLLPKARIQLELVER